MTGYGVEVESGNREPGTRPKLKTEQLPKKSRLRAFVLSPLIAKAKACTCRVAGPPTTYGPVVRTFSGSLRPFARTLVTTPIISNRNFTRETHFTPVANYKYSTYHPFRVGRVSVAKQ
ncbi:hypothetical protein EVAR_60267_1 [Eumeta japonica]|uniref:Uncharacterized protein n=1 Tax=Eumeta variegata TaxID=151549 RepID=A0A4C1Z4K5_EUMVA|nr:hypothetical protein EVAR_60267_1 [Eumeta japonica]